MTGVVLPHDDVGEGAAVVLLHAGVADRTMWSEHLAPLATAGYRAVALDLPGFGVAPVDEGEDAPWRDVLQTMDALGIGRATLVGNSFGGSVAQRVAALEPQRIESLALISSPATGVEPSVELQAIAQAEEAAPDSASAVEAVLAGWTLPDASQQLRDRVSAMVARAFELQAEAEWGADGFDPLEHDLEALSHIDAPVLVAVGEHDMRDFHVAADTLVEAFSSARKTVLPGAGHLAPIEQPEAFCELLLSSLPDQGH